MSKAQIVPPLGGGGGGMVGFEKLWEGDVTGSSDDITGGTVDLSEYNFLLIHYTGTIPSRSETSYIGIGAVRTDSNRTYDMGIYKTASGLVDVTMHLTRMKSPEYSTEWDVFRYPRYAAGGVESVVNPLKFFGVSGQTFHFSVYGLKL